HVTATSTDGSAAPSAASADQTVALNVAAVSDTPTVTVPDTSVTAISLNENDANITISGVIVTPATGDETDPVTVTLHVGHGTLTLNGSVDT
ncbi:hypothetical protein ACQ1Z3_14745, partial [Enterococcus faecalis]|uniref:hypothetical protein n=1 Tax=Enterococcus faecalis TaxID=1351 RepID=UPI003D6A2006